MATVRQMIDQIDGFVGDGGTVNLRRVPGEAWQGNAVTPNGQIAVIAQGVKFEEVVNALFQQLIEKGYVPA